MSGRARNYLAKLKSRSDEELHRSARELAVDGKRNDARLIAHIAEISDRTFHLELEYPSLFAYCIEELNLSEGSVSRRRQVANVCREFPQILEGSMPQPDAARLGRDAAGPLTGPRGAPSRLVGQQTLSRVCSHRSKPHRATPHKRQC
jgi:hypothetical protein